jgi:hypothetical protein
MIGFNIKKAYFDLVEEKLSTEPLDYAWVVQLYDEIKFKLIGILKPDSELRNDIEDRMDTELFEQMIRHRAFDYRDLRQLVNYTFDKILSLCAPVRDPGRQGDAGRTQRDDGQRRTHPRGIDQTHRVCQ